MKNDELDLNKFRIIVKKLIKLFILFAFTELIFTIILQILNGFDNFSDIILPIIFIIIGIFSFKMIWNVNIVGRNIFLAFGYVKIFIMICFLFISILNKFVDDNIIYLTESIILEITAFICGSLSVLITIFKLKSKEVWDLFQKNYEDLMKEYLRLKGYE